MRTRAFIASAICLVCLCSPSLGAQDLALFDPGVGVGGYTGKVEPLKGTVDLTWRPRAGIIGTVETLSLQAGDTRESVVTTFTGAVAADRTGLNRRFAVSELTVNGQSLTATRPLVIVDGWSDSQGGNVRDLKVTFPGFEENAIPPPAPGTPQHRVWVDLFAADLAYTNGPVGADDPVFDEASYHRLLEEQVRAVMGDPDSEIIENTFITRAVGITQRADGVALVAELIGLIEVRSGADRLIMESRGFGLIDLESGLSSGTSRTEITAIRDGRRANRTVVVEVQLLN